MYNIKSQVQVSVYQNVELLSRDIAHYIPLNQKVVMIIIHRETVIQTERERLNEEFRLSHNTLLIRFWIAVEVMKSFPSSYL